MGARGEAQPGCEKVLIRLPCFGALSVTPLGAATTVPTPFPPWHLHHQGTSWLWTHLPGAGGGGVKRTHHSKLSHLHRRYCQ